VAAGSDGELATVHRHVSLATLTTHLAGMGIAKPKWPEELRLVGDLPRTASGKIRKAELREAFS
jgi:non-ribosomal peptide synthetase component E (peptide arylation enzyme)